MKKAVLIMSLLALMGANVQSQAGNCVGTVVAVCEALFPPDNTTLEDDRNNTTCQTEGIKILCSIGGQENFNPQHLKQVVLKKRARQAKSLASRMKN
jgi:hypothetical protein